MKPEVGAIVFGTDQGMVGQFNERLAEFVAATLPGPGETRRVWVVGERMEGRLLDAGYETAGLFQTPTSVAGMIPLISELLLAVDHEIESGGLDEVHLLHSRQRQTMIDEELFDLIASYELMRESELKRPRR